MLLLCLCFPPTAKVIWLKVSSDRLVKPGIEPASPGLQGKWLIHYHHSGSCNGMCHACAEGVMVWATPGLNEA